MFKLSTFSFKPQKRAIRLPEGEHVGVLQKIVHCKEKGYFAFDILVDDVVFNTAFSVNNIVFNNFSVDYTDSNGCLVEEKITGIKIAFTVKDYNNGSEVKSKITAMESVK